MLEIREDQLEAMREAVRAGIGDAVLSALVRQGLNAARDHHGRVVVTDARGQRTSLAFGDDGAPQQLTFPSGEHVRFEHDGAGRFSALEHSGGQRVELGRDELGRITEVAQPGIERWRFAYDDGGRLGRIVHPDERATAFEHDDGGNLIAVIDRAGARTEYLRDKDGTLKEVRDPLGRSTRFETLGGALAAIAFPDGSREELAYDPESRVGRIRRRDGAEVYHQLDHEGAISDVLWPDGSWTRFEKNEDGHLACVRNRAGAVRFEHDGAGNAVKEKTPHGVVGMAYDAEGRLTRVTTVQGETIRYRYDPDGRLASIVDWEGREHGFRYGERGTVTAIHYGNGLVERQRYGASGRLEHARVERQQRPVSEQRYRYDACGRITEIEEVHPTRGFTRKLAYDAEGRLTSAFDSDRGRVDERYEYDAKGNMVLDGAVTIEVGPMDEIVRYGDEVVSYDALGNMSWLPGTESPVGCRFGPDGLLREARARETTWRYEYDALGRRVLKTDGVRSWRFGWMGHQLLWEEFVEAPGAAPMRRDYLWCPDSVVPVAFREGGRTYWLQCDARGAVIRAFRQDGTVAWSARYDSFGRAEVEIALVRQPFRLAGQYHDEETGLHYSLARYYSPWLKSYLSRDPLWHRPGATNYSYAKNSPYNLVDPFGGLAFLVAAVAAVAVGAAVGAIAAAITGGDPVAGAIEGGMAVVGGIVGGLLGGPAGAVAGAMAGNAAGAFVGSLVEQARNGDPLCLACAAKSAAVAAAIDVALLGLGKIPGVKRVVRAVGNKLAEKGEPIRRWAREQLGRVRWPWRRAAPKPKAPRQRTGDLDQLYRDAAVAQEELGRATRDVAARTNGRPIVPDKLKGRPRAEEKIRTDYGGDASQLLDLSRSSIEYENMDDLYRGKALLEQQYNVVRVKDRFENPVPGGYRDMLLNVEMPNGHITEVQLHSKQILEVKGGEGHKIYEEMRSIQAAAKDAGRALTPDEVARIGELTARSEQIYGEAFSAFTGGGG